jgi:protein-tyrosine phosphatase
VYGCTAEAAAVSEAYFMTLEASCESIREILAILTDASSYPAVICCPSGVDRTGIVAAVVLGLLDVPDDVIVTDYAASREAVLRRLGRLRFEAPSAVAADVDRYGVGLLGVLPDAMARFLCRVRAEHGSFAGYAESIDMAGAIPYLRAALLHPKS